MMKANQSPPRQTNPCGSTTFGGRFVANGILAIIIFAATSGLLANAHDDRNARKQDSPQQIDPQGRTAQNVVVDDDNHDTGVVVARQNDQEEFPIGADFLRNQETEEQRDLHAFQKHIPFVQKRHSRGYNYNAQKVAKHPKNQHKTTTSKGYYVVTKGGMYRKKKYNGKGTKVGKGKGAKASKGKGKGKGKGSNRVKYRCIEKHSYSGRRRVTEKYSRQNLNPEKVKDAAETKRRLPYKPPPPKHYCKPSPYPSSQAPSPGPTEKPSRPPTTPVPLKTQPPTPAPTPVPPIPPCPPSKLAIMEVMPENSGGAKECTSVYKELPIKVLEHNREENCVILSLTQTFINENSSPFKSTPLEVMQWEYTSCGSSSDQCEDRKNVPFDTTVGQFGVQCVAGFATIDVFIRDYTFLREQDLKMLCNPDLDPGSTCCFKFKIACECEM